MPHKANAACRHHIPRAKRRVTNWAEYDAALRQRGGLTVWFSEEAIAGWKASPRTTRGGQPLFSNMAIQTGLMLRTVFGLALRETEGLIGSIIHLLGIELAVPDHSTLGRRAQTVTVPKGSASLSVQLDHGMGNRRARSSSTPARPYIARLRVFSLLICPSAWPLLHGSVIAFLTASM